MRTEQQVLIIVTPGFPKDEADTTCLPAQQNLIKAINAKFPATKIIICSFQYPFFRSAYLWHGNRVIAFGGRNRSKLFRVLLWQKVWRQLKKMEQEYRIMAVLSFWYGECALIAERFATKFHLQHYCWLLGQDAKKENKYVHKANIQACNLIALSDFINDEFTRNYNIRPLHTIPFGIDIKEYPGELQQRDIDIVAAGSLIPLKQYKIFVSVIALLQKDFPSIKVLLCGDGPEKDSLQYLINTLSLEQNIILTGEKPHKEILSIMQRSKIFLHPSSYEGFGMVCAEALYAGCEVISFVQPVNEPVKHWHIVKNDQEMYGQCYRLLKTANAAGERLLLYNIDDTAVEVMKLFGNQ
jgi:glycosyltransferase involved in cell wall biosynthesis